jgi:hypothetical protein
VREGGREGGREESRGEQSRGEQRGGRNRRIGGGGACDETWKLPQLLGSIMARRGKGSRPRARIVARVGRRKHLLDDLDDDEESEDDDDELLEEELERLLLEEELLEEELEWLLLEEDEEDELLEDELNSRLLPWQFGLLSWLFSLHLTLLKGCSCLVLASALLDDRSDERCCGICVGTSPESLEPALDKVATRKMEANKIVRERLPGAIFLPRGVPPRR